MVLEYTIYIDADEETLTALSFEEYQEANDSLLDYFEKNGVYVDCLSSDVSSNSIKSSVYVEADELTVYRLFDSWKYKSEIEIQGEKLSEDYWKSWYSKYSAVAEIDEILESA